MAKRATRSSRRHLASDFEWENLPAIAPEALADFATEMKPPRHPPPTSAPETPAKQASLPPPHASAPEATPGELARLQLVKEAHELEVKKLELQLQLASLQHSFVAPQNAPGAGPSTKSLGDMKAPQRTLYPQPWPHIYAPGEPKLYSDLSMAEFCAGYAVILQNCQSAPDRERLLRHFHTLTTLACSYQWSAVRAFHAKVLRSIELGLITWADSFDAIKQPFFIPTALLEAPSPRAGHAYSRAPTSPNIPAIPHSQICDDWSWHAACDKSDCPKQHVCVVCKRSDHRALSCPKRKFPVPPRRLDPPPRD